MEKLKRIKRAGALCLACAVILLSSAGIYLQASGEGRSLTSPTEAQEVSGERTEQLSEASTEPGTELASERTSEKPTERTPEALTEQSSSGDAGGQEPETQEPETQEAETQEPETQDSTAQEGQPDSTGNAGESNPQTERETAETTDQAEERDADARPGTPEDENAQTGTPEDENVRTGTSEDENARSGMADNKDARPGTSEDENAQAGMSENEDARPGISENEDTRNETSGDETFAGAGAEDLTEADVEFQDKPEDLTELGQEDGEAGTELSLEDVLEEAQRQDIDFLGLAPGESLTFYASVGQDNGIMTMAVTAVTVTRAAHPYKYEDYEFGWQRTYRYTVSFNDITAVAYCICPALGNPENGSNYAVTKLKGAKALAKVCYYGTKAAGSEGFFTERYPDFTEGHKFIITHLAAAHANGSPDAFIGANQRAQELALELYQYCVDQPDIPEVDMEFSDAEVEAYADKSAPGTQRTKEVEFKADSLQSVVFKLPAGVVFHNVSTGETSRAGENVTVTGGTRFYLSAPLSQANDGKPVWTSTMKGNITKDYSAYKITTGPQTQDLALVFGEGVDDECYVDFSVKWLEEVSVKILKTDEETERKLQGAVFGVYADRDCRQLLATMPATDAQGKASVRILRTQDLVYLREITPPAGYVRDTKVRTVDLKAAAKTGTASCNVTNRRISAKLRLIKQDAQTGTPQGDAVLEHAVYGLYARADILHPDGSTGVLFHTGDQVTTLTTDAKGEATAEKLYPGKYYLKEISPPNGYLLDEKEYEIVFDVADEMDGTIEKECLSKESVIRQPFQLIKIAGNGKTEGDTLEGAGFTAYLMSSLRTRTDGSYDFAAAVPVALGKNGETEIFTDKDGYAVSAPLAFGTYLVRETTVPHGFAPVEDFVVRITENNPTKPQAWRVLIDEEFEARLKIIKCDDETQRNVLEANTEFKVYDLDAGKYVEQVTTYPKKVKHTSYFTDEEGYLILPESLSKGHYRIEEVTAPDGYTVGDRKLEVTVDSNVAYRMDDGSADTVVEVVASNHPVKGELKVIKKGDLLSGYEDGFTYEKAPLSGAVYEVFAAEDIYTADLQRDEAGNRTLEYAQGALAGRIVTGENGEGSLANLPLGTYKVVEKTAPDGFVLSEEEQEAQFVYVNQDTPVVAESVEFVNERQKVEISVVKKDAVSGEALEGAEFGLFAKKEMEVDGRAIAEADAQLATAVTGEDGRAVFSDDLPFGEYYVRELRPPEGFVRSEETVDLSASYQGQDTQTVQLEAVFENEPTAVEFTKSDLTTGEELDGASLSVLDQEGNVIETWVSERGNPHTIRRFMAN